MSPLVRIQDLQKLPVLDYPGRDLAEAILRPLVEPGSRRWAGHTVQRLLGFWVMWHAYGGQSGLVESKTISRANAFRTRAEFRALFGVNVEDFHPEVASVFRLHREAQQAAASTGQ